MRGVHPDCLCKLASSIGAIGTTVSAGFPQMQRLAQILSRRRLILSVIFVDLLNVTQKVLTHSRLHVRDVFTVRRCSTILPWQASFRYSASKCIHQVRPRKRGLCVAWSCMGTQFHRRYCTRKIDFRSYLEQAVLLMMYARLRVELPILPWKKSEHLIPVSLSLLLYL